MNKRSLGAIAAIGLTIGSGCMTSHQTRSTDEKGFLTNYSQLQEGEKGQALRIFVDEKASFKKYTKIYFKPIQVWKSKESSLDELEEKDVQALVDYFQNSIKTQLSKDYTFVDSPGEDVMTLRLALTDADDSNVAMDIVGHILPVGLGVSIIKRVAVGAHSFVGGASVEGELLDSTSGKRIAAFVDQRVGGLDVTGVHDKWSDTQDSFDHWAKLMQTRLAELKTK